MSISNSVKKYDTTISDNPHIVSRIPVKAIFWNHLPSNQIMATRKKETIHLHVLISGESIQIADRYHTKKTINVSSLEGFLRLGKKQEKNIYIIAKHRENPIKLINRFIQFCRNNSPLDNDGIPLHLTVHFIYRLPSLLADA